MMILLNLESYYDREHLTWYDVDLTFNDGYICKFGSSIACTALYYLLNSEN